MRSWLAPLVLSLATACGPAEVERTPADPSSFDSLLARGERVYLNGAYDSARALWNEALSRGSQAHDTLTQARALTWLGLTAWRLGDYAEARRLGEEALRLKRRLASDADLSKSYNALGLLAWNEGRLGDATELFGRASVSARAADDLKGIAAASGNLALVQTELGEFEQAREGFDSMLVAGRALEDPRIEGNALTNLGMLAVRVGDPASALPLLDSALTRYRVAAYSAGEQNALGQLGTAHAALGRHGLALSVLDSALGLSRRQGLRQDEASNLEAMAELYREVGDAHRALDLSALAAPINRELGLSVEAGADLRSVAEIHAELGALDAAREAGERALAMHRAAASRFEELTDLLVLADVADRSGALSQAAEYLAQARGLASELRVRRAVAEVALAEARLADRSRRPQAVLTALRDATPAVGAMGYGMEEEALRLKARALAQLGLLDSAATIGGQAVAALERIRGNLRSGELRASFLAHRQGAYADLADVLRRLGRTDESFEVADAARGRALLEGWATLRPDSGRGSAASRALQESDRALRTIATLQEQVRSVEAEAEGDSAAAARLRFLSDRLAGARREYEELAIRVKEIGSPATALLGVGRPRTTAVLAALLPDEALLEYQPVDGSLLIFVGRRGGLRVLTVPLPRGGMDSRVRLARELIAVRADTSGRALPVLRSLGDLLVGPARRSGGLTGVRRLVVVPHGVLAYLPFAALVDSETGRYLVQEFAVLTLPSAASLTALRSRGEPTLDAVRSEVFAPDPKALPATGAEATAVGRELPDATVRIGRGASELAAREALASGALVHLAAHAELNARNPMFSWLQTGTTRRDDPLRDGRLEVHEILGLPVRSPLVFLSGCETGLGAAGSTGFAPGEDFATLARAFLYAGAGNVVATLWRVDDQGAAAFASEYYRRFLGAGPVAALAEAQRTLAAEREYAAPYYWAGYTVAGSGSLGWNANPRYLSVR